MGDPSCVFCRIAAGAVPAARVLDTAEVTAFLDIGPLAPGHTLLIPKQHCESVLDASPAVLAALTAELPRLAAAIIRATGAEGLNVLQNTGASAGQVVPHLHLHLIPRRAGDHLGFRWNAGRYAEGESEAVRSAIVAALSA